MHNCGHRSGQLQHVRAAETLQISHRPDGMLTCFALCARRAVVSLSLEAQWPSHCAPSVGTQLHGCMLMIESSHALMGDSHVLLVVCRAAVSMSRGAQWPSHRPPSEGTQLHLCVLLFESSHSPYGKMADVPRLTTANALVNNRMYVQQRLENFPSPPWETHLLLAVCRAVASQSMEAQCQS